MQPKGTEFITLLCCDIKLLGRCSLPCVPYLGPMLNELAILFEVSPTYLEATDNSQKVVNFSKMRQVCLRHAYANAFNFVAVYPYVVTPPQLHFLSYSTA